MNAKILKPHLFNIIIEALDGFLGIKGILAKYIIKGIWDTFVKIQSTCTLRDMMIHSFLKPVDFWVYLPISIGIWDTFQNIKRDMGYLGPPFQGLINSDTRGYGCGS